MTKWSGQPSRHERGYGWEWVKLRKRILERDNHLCQCPECEGGIKRLRPATEVDHRVPKASGGSDDPDNLRSVHKDCHLRISMEAKGGKPRMGCDVNGLPLDPSHHWAKALKKSG